MPRYVPTVCHKKLFLLKLINPECGGLVCLLKHFCKVLVRKTKFILLALWKLVSVVCVLRHQWRLIALRLWRKCALVARVLLKLFPSRTLPQSREVKLSSPP